MSYTGIYAKNVSDQKTLNEEMLEGLVEVARRNPQYAVELFSVPLTVAIRLSTLSTARLDDLATTPAALWRPSLSEQLVRSLPERRPMPSPAYNEYRPLIERINRLVLATFVRYADDPPSAALVCGLSDPAVIRALHELPAFAFLEWGGNPGVLLARLILTDELIDRMVNREERVEPRLRGWLAFTQACELDFARLQQAVSSNAPAQPMVLPPLRAKRSGRPPANFMMPAISAMILMMLRHQMRPSEVEDCLIATNDVRAVQLRGIAHVLNPKPKRERGAPRDRSRDHRDLWGSASRRLTATVILILQRRLAQAGMGPIEAMVRAYDYYVNNYDSHCDVTLSRMLKDVFSAMQEGTTTHLSHCGQCGIVHLCHDKKSGVIECPVCVMARAGKYGRRPARLARAAHVNKFFSTWPCARVWPMLGPVEHVRR